MIRHDIILKYTDDETGVYYVASIPDLPGCMSHGETLEEAITMIQDAYECFTSA